MRSKGGLFSYLIFLCMHLTLGNLKILKITKLAEKNVFLRITKLITLFVCDYFCCHEKHLVLLFFLNLNVKGQGDNE